MAQENIECSTHYTLARLRTQWDRGTCFAEAAHTGHTTPANVSKVKTDDVQGSLLWGGGGGGRDSDDLCERCVLLFANNKPKTHTGERERESGSVDTHTHRGPASG